MLVKEKLKSIWECGQLLFKKTIFKNPYILQTYQEIIFNQIESEWNGEIIHHEVIRKSLKILIELGIKSTNVYKKEFEDQFLVKTREYYK